MPNWGEVLNEIQEELKKNPNSPALDVVRRKYLRKIYEITGRNTIAYYSGWLQKPKAPDTAVNDKDKSGFMLAIHKMDKNKGLDIVIHSPGGDIAATESLVDYLYNIFDKDKRYKSYRSTNINVSWNYDCFVIERNYYGEAFQFGTNRPTNWRIGLSRVIGRV